MTWCSQVLNKRDIANSAGDAVSGRVYVDSGCSNDLTFRFNCHDAQWTYDITVTSPSDIHYTLATVDDDTGIITVGINNTEVSSVQALYLSYVRIMFKEISY